MKLDVGEGVDVGYYYLDPFTIKERVNHHHIIDFDGSKRYDRS